MMRGIYDKKGEQFAYVEGSALFTLEDEPSGFLRGEFIVDLAGNKRWRLVGDAIFTLDESQSIGFIGAETPSVDFD